MAVVERDGTKQLNLERRRTEELKNKNDDLRSVVAANWGKEVLERADQAVRIPELEAQMPDRHAQGVARGGSDLCRLHDVCV